MKKGIWLKYNRKFNKRFLLDNSNYVFSYLTFKAITAQNAMEFFKENNIAYKLTNFKVQVL